MVSFPTCPPPPPPRRSVAARPWRPRLVQSDPGADRGRGSPHQGPGRAGGGTAPRCRAAAPRFAHQGAKRPGPAPPSRGRAASRATGGRGAGRPPRAGPRAPGVRPRRGAGPPGRASQTPRSNNRCITARRRHERGRGAAPPPAPESPYGPSSRVSGFVPAGEGSTTGAGAAGGGAAGPRAGPGGAAEPVDRPRARLRAARGPPLAARSRDRGRSESRTLTAIIGRVSRAPRAGRGGRRGSRSTAPSRATGGRRGAGPRGPRRREVHALGRRGARRPRRGAGPRARAPQGGGRGRRGKTA